MIAEIATESTSACAHRCRNNYGILEFDRRINEQRRNFRLVGVFERYARIVSTTPIPPQPDGITDRNRRRGQRLYRMILFGSTSSWTTAMVPAQKPPDTGVVSFLPHITTFALPEPLKCGIAANESKLLTTAKWCSYVDKPKGGGKCGQQKKSLTPMGMFLSLRIFGCVT